MSKADYVFNKNRRDEVRYNAKSDKKEGCPFVGIGGSVPIHIPRRKKFKRS